MKKKLLYILIFPIIFFLLPILILELLPSQFNVEKNYESTSSFISSVDSSVVSSEYISETKTESSQTTPVLKQTKTNQQTIYENFRILDKSAGEILTIPDRDFLYGAIVTEMSPQSDIEALKAQGVAAYTYYIKCSSCISVLPSLIFLLLLFQSQRLNYQ